MSSRFHVLGRLTILVGLGLWAVGCERGAELEGGPPPAIAPENGGDPALPGVVRVDAELQEHLDRELRAKSTRYAPRTHNLDKSGAPRFTNRLILESSPYLLQHAHNPVNWYPWSEEAFRRAKRENKPVFLSVGYSTCHWCHVMERESFEDPEIAAFLNRHFIAIKVDREERPDVDSVYMTAVQLLTGRGGWPMTVVMTPDKDPFFGGTYFPPRRGVRGARLGLVDILAQMAQLYTQDPTRALQQAQQLSQRVAEVTTTPGGQGVPSDRTIVAAVQRFAATFDPIHGGFGGAPKFPQPARLALLLRYARRTADPAALEIVTTTLDRMAAGGVYDHVGGGFHRYSTDREWLVPHFEKMLYDNAQLASVYVDAWQLTGDDDYRRVARDILDYVAREMTSSAGAFYSATDADSPTPSGHEEEGWFFTWSAEELQQLLGDGDAEIVGTVYGVTPDGNFEGRSILHRVMSDARAATELEISPERVDAGMRKARPLLYDARTSRPPPLRDEKVIAAWNGLMISAFAKAGWALDDPSYTSRAASAAQFVLDEMRDGQRLARTFKDGRRSEAAFLDDYAFLVAGCLDLYEATGDPFWLRQAISLQTRQDVDYVDREHGAYFMSARDGEVLLVREKPTYDGAIPSGNSVAALNLLRLHDFTGEVKWRLRAEKLFSALSARLQQAPSAHPALLVALDYYYDIALEVMLVAQERDATRPLAARLRTTFAPNKVFAVLDDAQALAQAAVVPWLEGKRPIGGKPTAYVCERGRCELPTSSPGVFQAQIDRRRPYPSYAKARPPKLEIGRGVTH